MAPKWNPPQRRHTCYWCVKIVKWIPVVFIVALIIWSYYAYVVQLCFFRSTLQTLRPQFCYCAQYHRKSSESLRAIFLVCFLMELYEKKLFRATQIHQMLYLIVFHLLFVMFVWSYWQTIFTEIGRVPKRFQLSVLDMERLQKEEMEENQRRILDKIARQLPVLNFTTTRSPRYCEKCCHIKPDRAHHCSACGDCVLKMDHHCPWVNNCVAFTNYKFFVLFLGYSLIYCLFVTATSVQYFVKFWKNELTEPGRFHILFLFFMAVMFAISLASLFGYHCYLVTLNRTTLESFRAPIFQTGPDKDGFNLGRYQNFLAVFGENKRHWFLPLTPPTSLDDGVVYPTRTPHANSYNSMGSTQTSCVVGDGVSFPQRTMADDQDGLLGQRQRWAEEGRDSDGHFLAESQPEQTAAVNQSISRSSFASDAILIAQ